MFTFKYLRPFWQYWNSNETFQLKLKAKDPSGIGASTHVKYRPSCPTNILRFLKSDDAHAAAVLRLSRTLSGLEVIFLVHLQSFASKIFFR